MALTEDYKPRKAPLHEIGQDLSALSLDELGRRIDALKAEIVRLEAEIAGKGATMNAAESLFRRP